MTMHLHTHSAKLPTALCYMLLILATCCAGTRLQAEAAPWELSGTIGNSVEQWKEGSNWRFEDGNPRTFNGAGWLLWYQALPDQSALTPMVAGKAYDYNFVWREAGDSFDPNVFYIEKTLHSQTRPAGPGLGQTCGILWTPEKAGAYHLIVNGDVEVENLTAGNARLTLAICDQAGAITKTIQEVEANSPDGFGGFPSHIAWDEVIALGTGEGIFIALQSVNPGSASAGRSSLTFTDVTVEVAAPPTSP